jgi:hypothetical protein
MAVTLPFTFAPGQVADANQVNSNFTALLGGVNIGGPAAGQPWSVAQGGTGTNGFATRPTTPGVPQFGVLVADGTNPIAASAGAYLWAATGLYSATLALDAQSNTDWECPQLSLERSRGTMSAPLPVQNGDVLGTIMFWGYPPVSGYGGAGQLDVYATETHSTTARGSRLVLSATPNGSLNRTGSAILAGNGDFTITGNAYKPAAGGWNAPSDARTKRNAQPYQRGLADLLKLSVITFEYNGKAGTVDDGSRQPGFAAEEVLEVMPEAVGRHMVQLEPPMRRPSMDREMRSQEPSSPILPDTEILTLDPVAFTYVIINSIKELAAKVEALAK